MPLSIQTDIIVRSGYEVEDRPTVINADERKYPFERLTNYV
jgi:hypothetical protein